VKQGGQLGCCHDHQRERQAGGRSFVTRHGSGSDFGVVLIAAAALEEDEDGEGKGCENRDEDHRIELVGGEAGHGCRACEQGQRSPLQERAVRSSWAPGLEGGQ